MAADFKTWTKGLFRLSGSALAGPAGALIGSLAGGLITTLGPGDADFLGDIAGLAAQDDLEAVVQRLLGELDPIEKKHLNQDLQMALRDALREAIYDLGGEACFPLVWRERPHRAPAGIQYLTVGRGQEPDARVEPIGFFFKETLNAIAEQRFLPVEPPQEPLDARQFAALNAATPQGLNEAFFNTILLPFFHGFGSLYTQLPDFETHLRRYLLDQTWIHLGTMLKARGPAWAGYNRLALEALRSQVRLVDASQDDILLHLDALLGPPEIVGPDQGGQGPGRGGQGPGPGGQGPSSQEQAGRKLAQWADGLADLISAAGGLEKPVHEGFEAVVARLAEEHNEALLNFHHFISTLEYPEEQNTRNLRFLENGRYEIDGPSSIPADEPPEPGEPPYKGLASYTETDDDIFYGREALVSSLVGRLRAGGAGRRGTPDRGNLLAVIGAAGSGKTSLVRAGLIPALRGRQAPARGEPGLVRGRQGPGRGGQGRGDQPLLIKELPPLGSERWPVCVMTPTSQPLIELATCLTRQPPDSAESITLASDLRRNPNSLDGYVRKLLEDEAASQGRKLARNTCLLLVVDQFEELFTLCRDETERQAFVNGLLAAVEASPLQLVIVLRADYYIQCARYENLRQAITTNQEYVGMMNAAEVRQAIEEPAHRGGWDFESGLVSQILQDLGNTQARIGMDRPVEPCALPQLSLALLEMWRRRRGRVMVYESYAETGGVANAVAQTAGAVFSQQLDLAQQIIAQRIFLRLIDPDEPSICYRLPLSELSASPEADQSVNAVLQILAGAGLISLESDSAAIAHEALIETWPALQQWLEEARQDLRLHAEIRAAVQNWQQAGNNSSAALRGARLAQAAEWAEAHPGQITSQEQEFLEFSKYAAGREAAAREVQRQNEIEAVKRSIKETEARRKTEAERALLAEQETQRLHRNNRILIGGSLLMVLLAILAGVYTGYSRQQTNRADQAAQAALYSQVTAEAGSTQVAIAQSTTQARAQARATAEADALAQKAAAEAAQAEAQRQNQVSLARELAAQSSGLAERDPDLALLLGVEAVNISTEPDLPAVVEAQTALFHVLQVANFSQVLRGYNGEVLSAAYSPDGKDILTTSQEGGPLAGSARLWDLTSGQAITIATYTAGITSASFNAQGTLILTTGQDQGSDGAAANGVADLWTVQGEHVATLAGHTGAVLGGSFSPDGSLVVTAGQDKTARLWRTPILSSTVPTSGGASILVATLAGHSGSVTSASFSPDGQRIITLSQDGTARLWDNTGMPVVSLIGHTKAVLAASFSPDSTRIVTASADGTARLWLADGTPVTTLAGHTGAVYSAVFSPDGKKIVTASADGTARLWRSDGSLLAVLAGHSGPINMAVFSPDGAHILTASADHTARLWDADGSPVTTLTGHTAAVYTARFSADGSQLVTASADDTARVWDLNRLYAPILVDRNAPVAWAGFSPDGQRILTAGTDNAARLYRLDGSLIATLTGHTGGLTNASFSPDGNLIATASRDGTARIWSKEGVYLTALQGNTGPVRSVDFSPDSKLVVTASEDGTARIYHISGSLVQTLEGHTGVVWSAFFSPDGSRIVTAGQDGTARIWDTQGQLLQTIDNNAVPVDMAAFSPDGQMVITAGQDGITRLWLTDGTPIASLEGHTQMVNWAAFSLDGKLIATASNDGTARLWTLDGKFLASVEGHSQGVNSVNFSPDGQWLVTASRDGTVRLWSLYESLQALRAEAIHRAGRWLTPAECQRYLHQSICPPEP